MSAQAIDRRPALLERAFELARTGDCTSLRMVQECLSEEGYTNTRAVFGCAPGLRKEIRAAIRAAKGGAEPAPQ
jgi:hypothetical protein